MLTTAAPLLNPLAGIITTRKPHLDKGPYTQFYLGSGKLSGVKTSNQPIYF